MIFYSPIIQVHQTKNLEDQILQHKYHWNHEGYCLLNSKEFNTKINFEMEKYL